MKIVMQATTADYGSNAKNHFLVSLADIDVIRLKKPTFDVFLASYLYIVDNILNKISLTELSTYAVYLPVFRISLELGDEVSGDIVNKKYDTALASLYVFNRESVVESANRLFLSLSKDYFQYHNINMDILFEDKKNKELES